MTTNIISFDRKKKEVGPRDPSSSSLLKEPEAEVVEGVSDIERITDHILEHIDELMHDCTKDTQEIELGCMSIETKIDGGTFFADAFKISELHCTHQCVAPGIASFRMSVNHIVGYEKAAEPLLYLDQIVYMLAGSLAENKAFAIHSGERELKLIFPADHPKYDQATVLIVKITIHK